MFYFLNYSEIPAFYYIYCNAVMTPQVFAQFFHIVILEFYRNAAQIEHGIFQIVFDEMK